MIALRPMKSSLVIACVARLAAAMAGLSLLAGAALAGGYERVRLPSYDGDLDAVLYRPKGPGPFPAVVALHGCGGLFRESGKLSLRHSDWGERLAAEGYVVLMPDSYGSRRLGSQCGVKEVTVRASRERVADAAAARHWLQARSDIRSERIALLGWSGGGSSVLAAIRKDRRPADEQPDFARAIAFYPGCRVQSESTSFMARLPLLMLVGDADDWTPPGPCDYLAKAARGRGEKVEIVIYPGALHDFDHPRLEVKERSDIAFSATGTGKATVGTNPEAREDAIKRVKAFLRGL
ncbi:dienelactone hydrolase family protein [Bosea sp. (in: a-proteobacteria)]|uniref:dienelactone hydrolase family protein n=1 Tax=Bosea sp. (in: a-proteobacteria) TaxID=1871050 RepID=UPI002B47C8D3|nr:dienelactone hydrolase family protein [Bosea sp. (in: a-proteobacteria)]WRH57885.1 MAG: dienelactone hydrolase family protein [Bosea sp. (in: a-proteobacteria)]